MESWIIDLQEWTASLPPAVAWLGVMAAAAIPFVESYLGSVIGVAAGLPWGVAVAVAVVGNVVSMLVFVLTAGAVRDRVSGEAREESPRRRKVRRAFDRYGVAGVSLLGQTILPSQITSAAMVSFGASRTAVIGWQIVSIILWGVDFGLLAVGGLNVLTG